MEQIKQHDGLAAPTSLFSGIRKQLGDGIKWWAEHQAWPATDEIRIEQPQPGCRP